MKRTTERSTVSRQGQRNLPWHDHNWLRRELRRLGTVKAVARLYDVPESTLYNYMSRHGIRAPHRPAEFGRPLQNPARPSRVTLWRRRKRTGKP
ncbi:hypothetical protein Mesil_3613 (plasmid) [Allomeiothermus silvanus DSM 9946]|uniref:Uncharacterized protein n=1 Tax=Allomeiothermus silvanus (strain ATCC 700542 / DSM 9946 / NBRC 106475 / NCIMB 13440 / VI-R2) TaxID=526227 RepID=D7BJP7_ALLS1|nr:hypothetical protein [Allomeiothermus silvanus]ADH65403.1 hypothetical protein Mesil_3613 [Allomeiothermus silvanus DSM 9946]